jgi:hypothetical protein
MQYWQKHGNNTDHPVVFDRLTSLSDEDKVFEAMDILIAGADTTASTLTTGLANILSQSDVHRKLREALVGVSAGPDGRFSLQDLEKCQYLVSRLWPLLIPLQILPLYLHTWLIKFADQLLIENSLRLPWLKNASELAWRFLDVFHAWSLLEHSWW